MIVSQLMGPKQQIFLLFLFLQVFAIAAKTDTGDFAVLSALMKDSWKNKPSSWTGDDPCGDKWEGIQCSNSRITDMVLSGQGLAGKLTGDIGNLIALEKLDLSLNKDLTGNLPPTIGNLKNLQYLSLHGCSFSGPIPDTIGSLNQLLYLSLGANNFTGEIPHSFGNLLKLYWLDITDNNISGEIPVSNETSPGLDLLVDIQHFHFGQNELEGTIPPQLFSSKMKLLHVLFDDNRLTGSIPSTITLVRTLEVIKLDRNSLSGVVNLSGLVSLTELYLSNNKLTGPMPDLRDMNLLTYVDMSNNSFDASSIPQWFSSLQSLTTLIMENTLLQGRIPVSLFSSTQLQTIVLSNNKLNGTLDIGYNYSRKLKLIDLQKNDITQFTEGYEYNGALKLQASWDNNGKSGSRPQITGLRCFSFEEIKKSTSNFSDANIIGTGGYGKVSRFDRTLIFYFLFFFFFFITPICLIFSGKSGVRLSWERRLKIALDSARGLAYLHDHVNPPIIHRDVKSSNILLDDQLNGKVADFGLSKLLGHSSHVSDNVKGTMHLILDPTIAFSSTLKGLEKFVDLAIRCVEELRVNRPTMTEVVKEIENILQQACLHSDVELVSNSNSQDVSSGSSFYSPIINKDQEYSSGSFPYSEIELK
ncbi:hypothetical protein GH714_006497 [Hevea brasiliensis]|uniref:non-specific serine/threonine protein kinase n=1 Tax=Hevea brasiliensis TaxID=3981 RepID=A0A6A6MDP2_HEVBR|nr:hypothetical protein GH714_006497 [Hevea brasiliensis]